MGYLGPLWLSSNERAWRQSCQDTVQGLDIAEVAGGVGDEEHVEGLLEVADHTGAFTGKKRRQTLYIIGISVTSQRVPLHGAPLPKQI